ncbi:MAG: alkaline phosphatase family protein [Agathobacter sp.]
MFSTLCVSDIIKEYKPDVLFTHPASVDSYKHTKGTNSPETREMMGIVDNMVGDIINAT